MRARKGSKKKAVRSKVSVRSASRGSRTPSRGRRSLPVLPPALLQPETAAPQDVLIGGPGERYVLGPQPPVEQLAWLESAELPEAYGSGRLLMVARDPYSVFVHWDFTASQLAHCQSLAHDGKVRLRVGAGGFSTAIVELALLHGTKSQFVKVPRAGSEYQAELGYYRAPHRWVGVCRSAVVRTPVDALAEPISPLIPPMRLQPAPLHVEECEGPNAISPDQGGGVMVDSPAELRTKEPSLPAIQIDGRSVEPGATPEPRAHEEGVGLESAEGASGVRLAMARLEAAKARGSGVGDALDSEFAGSPAQVQFESSGEATLSCEGVLPGDQVDRGMSHPNGVVRHEGDRIPGGRTIQQERALAEMVVEEAKRLHQAGSLEVVVTDAAVRQRAGPVEGVEQRPLAQGGMVPGSALPEAGEVEGPGGFWFAVNAELVVYGATEPGARVSVGNRPVRLRADGTFSCRFALPDGVYQLEFQAVSAENSESRAVELRLSRATRDSGGVERAPQDPGLKAPDPGAFP